MGLGGRDVVRFLLSEIDRLSQEIACGHRLLNLDWAEEKFTDQLGESTRTVERCLICEREKLLVEVDRLKKALRDLVFSINAKRSVTVTCPVCLKAYKEVNAAPGPYFEERHEDDCELIAARAVLRV